MLPKLMRYRDAVKLHNGDEVTHKQTKQVCVVYVVKPKGSLVLIDVCHPEEGYITITHLDVS